MVSVSSTPYCLWVMPLSSHKQHGSIPINLYLWNKGRGLNLAYKSVCQPTFTENAGFSGSTLKLLTEFNLFMSLVGTLRPRKRKKLSKVTQDQQQSQRKTRSRLLAQCAGHNSKRPFHRTALQVSAGLGAKMAGDRDGMGRQCEWWTIRLHFCSVCGCEFVVHVCTCVDRALWL